MAIDSDEFIKQREVVFMLPQHEHDPAGAAIQLLQDIDGIHAVSHISNTVLQVSYDIREITLNAIEDALQEIGFHLDNSILSKLKRALIYYAEDTQLANLGYDHAETKSTLEIFISQYSQRRHGCRDERPSYYRRYG
ncbi:MAG: hypothetical protein PVH04_04660 [Gammaproteobacteria bacterium]|jgi:hypothetical protein